jgi:hypothetical protein
LKFYDGWILDANCFYRVDLDGGVSRLCSISGKIILLVEQSAVGTSSRPLSVVLGLISATRFALCSISGWGEISGKFLLVEQRLR